VQRAFAAGAAIGLSFQIARAKDATGAAAVRYVLRDDRGQAMENVEVPYERAVAVSHRIDGYDIGVRLPANPGRYVASIEASDGRGAVRRQVLFTVR
jgi:hypothetical protein